MVAAIRTYIHTAAVITRPSIENTSPVIAILRPFFKVCAFTIPSVLKIMPRMGRNMNTMLLLITAMLTINPAMPSSEPAIAKPFTVLSFFSGFFGCAFSVGVPQ